MIEKIISKLKKNKEYSIESKYSTLEWSVILYERGFQLLRGLIAKFFRVRARGFFFKGKNVRIRHRSLFKAGKNLILEDNVHINALSKNGIHFGDNVTISKNCTLICTGVIAQKGTGISIGNHTGINANCFFGGQGGIQIGNNVIIGPYVKVFSENHNFGSAERNIKDQGVSRKGVIIEDDCWIGAGVIILDGVTIKKRTVIAAGSVVSRSFTGSCILAGVPAKVIKNI